MEMLAAINRTQAVISPDRTADVSPVSPGGVGARPLRGRRADRAADVSADYSSFDELWSTLEGGVGPAGVWLLSLSDEQRAAAREELYRQVGEPAGAFTLTGSAWAARVTRA